MSVSHATVNVLNFRTFFSFSSPNILDIRTECKKGDSKDQESIQSSTPPDPGYQWESDNFTIIRHRREPRGQPFPSR